MSSNGFHRTRAPGQGGPTQRTHLGLHTLEGMDVDSSLYKSVGVEYQVVKGEREHVVCRENITWKKGKAETRLLRRISSGEEGRGTRNLGKKIKI